MRICSFLSGKYMKLISYVKNKNNPDFPGYL
jgi:hypothetical protein